MRDLVFISHANPDDNEFSRWLALRLAAEGYAVWSDLTELLGGEDFWVDIDTAIRERSVKFLYVLSRVSNNKPGVLKELALAQTVARRAGLQDFIIPLQIDDLRHSDINIEVHRLNTISFVDGWASGLTQLLGKLFKDQVPKNSAFSPSAVAAWWKSYADPNEGIVAEPESHLSNWFETVEYPPQVRVFRLAQQGNSEAPHFTAPFPIAWHGPYAIMFAPREALLPFISPDQQIVEALTRDTETFLQDGVAAANIDRREARSVSTSLLRQAWSIELHRRELPTYMFSGTTPCLYFVQGMMDRDRVVFLGVNGRQTYRQIVGKSTMSRGPGRTPTVRFWHFGIELRPFMHPFRGFVAKPRVLFSSDGQTIWDSKARLQRARLSECKDWWNAEWRDRTLAAMSWLADGGDRLILPVGGSEIVSIAATPTRLQSPVTLREPRGFVRPIDVAAVEEETEHELDGEVA